jgi:hypothetical protein
MEPNFSEFYFRRANKGSEELDDHFRNVDLGFYKPATGAMALILEWKEDGKSTATSCIVKSDDDEVWKITAEKVEQYKAPELAALEEAKEMI